MIDPSNVEGLLMERESALLDPDRRRSDAVAGWLAASFVEFGSSGRIHDRQSTIEALQSPSQPRLRASDMRVVRLAETVALVTYRSFREEGPTCPTLRSSLWRRIDDCWLLVFHQGTREAES